MSRGAQVPVYVRREFAECGSERWTTRLQRQVRNPTIGFDMDGRFSVVRGCRFLSSRRVTGQKEEKDERSEGSVAHDPDISGESSARPRDRDVGAQYF